MTRAQRREFLNRVSGGMLAIGLGTQLADDLGCSTAWADAGPDALPLGAYARLVDLMQSQPAERLQRHLIQQLGKGETDLRTLTAAAALANAETFGGQDYVGFHTAMAMLPALNMSSRLPSERQALPVLKVIYRNALQIEEFGGSSVKTLTRLANVAAEPPATDIDLRLRTAARAGDMSAAEATFGELQSAPLQDTFNALLPTVEDDINVHRFVLAHRAFGLADLLGSEFAHTMLRQCVRFCVDNEQQRLSRQRAESPIRQVLPKLFDQYRLASCTPGKRDPGDAWVDATSQQIYQGPPQQAAEIVASCIADGIALEVVGEAISLASNLLSLRQGADPWRTHGDAAGVHASDATNAWRNIARVADTRNAIAGLLVAAYHSAAHSPFSGEAYPTAEHCAAIRGQSAAELLDEMAAAIERNDQGTAAAAVEVYRQRGFAPGPVFDRALHYTVSEDGRLHGEKYFNTTHEEFMHIRPAFRWRQLVSLARVTASAYGFDRQDQSGHRAPGYEQACGLLGVDA